MVQRPKGFWIHTDRRQGCVRTHISSAGRGHGHAERGRRSDV